MSLIIIPILTATIWRSAGFRYLGEDGLDIIKSRNTRFANRESGEFDFGVIYAWTDLDVKTEQVAMGVGSVYEPAYNITEGIDLLTQRFRHYR